MSLKQLPTNKKGSGLTMVFIGLSGMLLVLIIFISIADFALYSTKRNMISRGIDYAVCAAIQEIDSMESEDGLAKGFDETTGKLLVDGIVLNEARSDNAFFSTLQINTGIMREVLSDNMLIITISPNMTGLEYVLRKGQQKLEGSVTSPVQLEPIINNAIEQFWEDTSQEQDSHIIYVNGNLDTNQFKKVPYYMVFIKDYRINGLFRKRTATFVGFAGAKIERGEF
jgi:hypothetical protein